MLKGESKEKYKSQLRHKTSKDAREQIFKNVIKECKLVRQCKYCDAPNGTVRHQTGQDATLILHDKYK